MRSFYRLAPAIIAGACMLGFFSGCAKAPNEELAAARAAVKAAQVAEADKYMPNNFQTVQQALAEAEAELTLQNNASALSRTYKKAKQLLSNVTSLATQMKAEAPGAKAEMKAQVEINLPALQKMAKETSADIKKAPRSKGKEVIAQMKVDLSAADSAIMQAATDFAGGNIVGASQKLGNASKLLKRISDKLSTGGTEGLM